MSGSINVQELESNIFKKGEWVSKKSGLFEKGGDKYPLRLTSKALFTLIYV